MNKVGPPLSHKALPEGRWDSGGPGPQLWPPPSPHCLTSGRGGWETVCGQPTREKPGSALRALGGNVCLFWDGLRPWAFQTFLAHLLPPSHSLQVPRKHSKEPRSWVWFHSWPRICRGLTTPWGRGAPVVPPEPGVGAMVWGVVGEAPPLNQPVTPGSLLLSLGLGFPICA